MLLKQSENANKSEELLKKIYQLNTSQYERGLTHKSVPYLHKYWLIMNKQELIDFSKEI